MSKLVVLGAAPKGRVLWNFGLKTGIGFVYFGLELGMFLRELQECVNVLILLFQFQMTKKERKMCKFEMDFRNQKSFLLCS